MFFKFYNSTLAISILTTFSFLSFLKQRTVFRKVLFLALLMYATIAGAQTQNIPGFTGRYIVTDLGRFTRDTYVEAINSSGQIVGEWYDNDQIGYCFRTAPYSPINPATDYLNPPGTFCHALGINDLGQVVGTLRIDYITYAFRTAPNSPINLDTDLLGQGIAHDINNLGQVTGSINGYGFRTAPNSAVNWLTDNLGANVEPRAINDNGEVVGSVRDIYDNRIGFRSSPNNQPDLSLTSLGLIAGTYSFPLDINNSGQIVGVAAINSGNAGRPFFLEPTETLSSVNGIIETQYNSSFLAVNSYGTAVGVKFDEGSSILYRNGQIMNIDNQLVLNSNSWSLKETTDINDSGYIIGWGWYNGEAYHSFLLTPYIDTIPPVLNIPANISVAAESSSGTVVSYSTSAIDDFFNPASINCNHPSGSLFPIGTTSVSCTATDGAGNTSAPRTFSVEVVDTAPNLSLPPYISTNATSASGAIVTYFASADDAVSGQLPATCSPASGTTFPIGQTTVNCLATDGAGNTSTGSFEVYVLTSDQIFTPSDYYVTVQPNNSTTITFTYVESPGVTTVQPIDAATIGTTPAGFALSNGIAYQISTTAGVYFDYGVELIFAVPGPISEADFNNLRILHNNNGTLEDVTSGYGYNAETQSGNIHAYTYSFSPFYLAKQVDKRISPLFNQTTAHRIGSTIPIKLRVLNGSNVNISSGNLTLKARNLVRLGSNTTSVVMDAGNSNPDFNFRYDAALQGYIFNLKTTGLTAGKYALSFYAGSDTTFFYTVQFEVR